MNVLLIASAAGLITTAVFAPLVKRRHLLFLLFPAALLYLVGCAIWFVGIYVNALPVSRDSNSLVPTLPPLALSIVYGGWLTARVRSAEQHRRVPLALWWRRFVQLGVTALIVACVTAGQVLLEVTRGAGSGKHNALAALIAVVVLIGMTVVGYIKDRDAELAFLMAGFSLIAVVPLVVLGRVLYISLAMALDALI